ncbi:MAG: thioredoxin [Myxococcales bacterium]|nr:thioredoxin [Myxococcales bacterium]
MGKAIEIESDSFEAKVLNAEQPVLVDFWAEWCAPCRMVAPMIEQVARDYEGRAVVAKVDVDSNQEIAQRYGIRAIPTLLFFHKGEVVDRVVGMPAGSKVLSDKLDGLL